MLIIHARLATLDAAPRLIDDGALYIEEDRISAVGTAAELTARYPKARCWDAAGQMALPAAICAHTHF